jgi:hypothetical protein
MFLRESTCLFCLGPSSARLGLDKKSRPYLHCVACGARSFLPLFDPCLNGLAVLPQLIEAWRATISPEARRSQLAILLAELQARARGPATAPLPAPDVALGNALEKIA